jgi:hypothetical protein
MLFFIRLSKTCLTIVQELAKYKEIMKKEALVEFDQFWEINSPTLPILTNLVHEFCIINATSVPSESTFSVGGIILGNKSLIIGKTRILH